MTDKDLARDYVFGSLSSAERREVDRLRRIDSALDAEIRELDARMAPLTAAAGTSAPPPGLFDRIMQAVAAEDAVLARTHRLPFAEGPWDSYAAGVTRKFLWNAQTFLLRCEPGAVIPPHGHDEDEHLIVVSGDLLINGVAFAMGDYHTMKAGTRHDDARTVGGCILFIQTVA